jgi:MFS superfamily sulfate permease-like transporter
VRRSGSWVTSIVGFALAILVACYCLNLAAQYLREALPILILAVVIAVIGIGTWHWYHRPRGW